MKTVDGQVIQRNDMLYFVRRGTIYEGMVTRISQAYQSVSLTRYGSDASVRNLHATSASAARMAADQLLYLHERALQIIREVEVNLPIVRSVEKHGIPADTVRGTMGDLWFPDYTPVSYVE